MRPFTEAITEECKPYNIQVMLLCPGLTKTNFNKAAGIENEKGLNTEYNSSTQTPEQVAEEVLKALDKEKHLIVSGAMNRFGSKMVALVPNRLFAKGFAKLYRKKMGL